MKGEVLSVILHRYLEFSVVLILGQQDMHPAFSKKVKASHTRYRALGPDLIPVYRQSACR